MMAPHSSESAACLQQYKQFKNVLKTRGSRGNAISLISESLREVADRRALSSYCLVAGEDLGESGTTMQVSSVCSPGPLMSDSEPCLPDAVRQDVVKQVRAVVAFYKSRSRRILHRGLAATCCKPLVLLGAMKSTTERRVQEGRYLVSYAAMNAAAIRLMEKKLTVAEVHTGCVLRSKLSALHAELVQSPLLVELLASHVDSQRRGGSQPLPEGFLQACCDLEGVKPSLSCDAIDAFNLNFDLTCSICLDTLFFPVALSCGHLFCYSCACYTASVPAFQGLKHAKRSAKCPLCRQSGVYPDATHLEELNGLIKHRCESYWRQRSSKERAQQMQEMRSFYARELQLSMGYASPRTT